MADQRQLKLYCLTKLAGAALTNRRGLTSQCKEVFDKEAQMFPSQTYYSWVC